MEAIDQDGDQLSRFYGCFTAVTFSAPQCIRHGRGGQQTSPPLVLMGVVLQAKHSYLDRRDGRGLRHPADLHPEASELRPVDADSCPVVNYSGRWLLVLQRETQNYVKQGNGRHLVT